MLFRLFSFLSLLNMSVILANEPVAWGMTFQEAASPPMAAITSLHNLILVIITGIAIFVACLLAYTMIRFRASKNPVPSKTTHHVWLEIIWTILPVCILVVIAIPSMRFMFQMDKPQHADMTIKAIGHQWYWEYEYANPKKDADPIKFDSYLVEDKNLKEGQKRLLSVDNPIVVPENATVKVLVTAADVLHSFAVPALGIKRDAVPGRINETWFRIKKKGTYYGQCSELCGIKHGFMPIVINVVTKQEYDQWLAQKAQH